MTKQYGWASNQNKLVRAIGKVGKDASEQEVKDEYVKIGGLVVHYPDVVVEDEKSFDEPETVEATEGESEPVETPKKKVSKKK